MERWVADFDSWAVCDGACLNLFRWTPSAYQKCFEWSSRPEQYVKRAAFALMAGLAVSDKAASDQAFLAFLPIIAREASDERNFVKKAVNWALRQIGKRNRRLNRAALRSARAIHRLDSPSARWIASDALPELASDAVQKRLKSKRPSAKFTVNSRKARYPRKRALRRCAGVPPVMATAKMAVPRQHKPTA